MSRTSPSRENESEATIEPKVDKVPFERSTESQPEPKVDKVPFDRSLPPTRSQIEPPIGPKVDRSL